MTEINRTAGAADTALRNAQPPALTAPSAREGEEHARRHFAFVLTSLLVLVVLVAAATVVIAAIVLARGGPTGVDDAGGAGNGGLSAYSP